MGRRDSEVEAYIFIKDKLEELGWDPRNPERSPNGQVYTQNQALEKDALQTALGQEQPENIVKISETKYWVIEAKNRREKLDQAVSEAEDYAEKINAQETVDAVLISGVAGNDADKFDVENRFLKDGSFLEVNINGRPTSALLSPEIVTQILDTGSADIEEFPVDEEYFLSKAEQINQILHDGAIRKSDRAKVISALLLALIDGSEPDLDADTMTLIGDINTRVESALRREGKPGFIPQIKLTPPSSEDNYVKFRNALVQTIRELKDLNIRSAMNSAADVLGEFYEVFLKYGNGAKEIGIVLTPRHITSFAAEAIDVNHNDIVYDPTCGTGGFLVAAYDRVRQNATEEQHKKFKTKKLFGIDQEPSVLSMAIVNMIFRGDGKNNIKEHNCFHNHLTKTSVEGVESAEYVKNDEDHDPPVNKALMNPPFSLNNPDERPYRFVERTLGELEDGGLLFSVMPYPTMVKQGQYKEFRERFLKDHTLLSVITFPPDLFYPVGQHTAGIIIEKGSPHPEEQSVLWIRALHDGRVKSKGKRLPREEEPNDFEQIEPVVRSFVQSPDVPVETIPQFQRAAPIDFDDPLLELAPEAYLTREPPSGEELEENIESSVREAAASLLRSQDQETERSSSEPASWEQIEISEYFSLQHGDFNKLPNEEGDIPTISRKSSDNGISRYCKPPEEANVYSPPKITVSTVSGKAFVQLQKFIASDKVVILTPRDDMDLSTIYFFQAMIDHQSWRYSYGRSCFKDKLSLAKMYVPLDSQGSLDTDYMEDFMENTSNWDYIEKSLNDDDGSQ